MCSGSQSQTWPAEDIHGRGATRCALPGRLPLQWELPSACVRAWSEELRGRGSEPPQADLRRLALAADKEVVPQDTTDR